MNISCDSASTKKSSDYGFSLHDSIGSDDYENDSGSSANHSRNGDMNEYKQLAAIIVDNLLSKAIAKASAEVSQLRELHIQSKPKSNETDSECLPPAIQIDFVGPRTPSPDEEPIFEWSYNKKQYKFKNSRDPQSPSIDTDFSFNDFEVSEKDDNSIAENSVCESASKNIPLNEVRAFAKEYVTNIISSALETAINNTSTETTIAERYSQMKSSRSDNQAFESTPWYSRLRQILSRLMRSTCLCKSKQEFRQKKT